MKRVIPVWFDIDGTLLHTRAGHGAFQRALKEVYGWEADMSRVRFAGNTDLQVLMDLSRHHCGSTEPGLQRKQDFFDRMAVHLDNGLGNAKPELVPGAWDLVKTLAGREDVLLGLITGNARECAFLKLRHVDLHPHFSDGGFGDEHADRNVLARGAQERLVDQLAPDVSLDRGWLIGDTPRDMEAARHIGARALGVSSGACSIEELTAAGADRVVTDLHPDQDLLRLLMT